ncbi:MAG: hypothetical protein JNM17_01330 [Archangium sp.]|nr:hypothetical protein [Archangium sp.]
MWAVLGVMLSVVPPPTPAQQRLYEAHRACTQKKDAAACERALTSYPPYLEVHASDWDARFFFAELLWEKKLIVDAAAQYRIVARGSGRYAKRAAVAEISALSKVARPKPHRRDGQPWPLTVEQLRLLDAIDFLLARWPEEPNEEYKLTSIRLLIDAHDFDGAERRLASLRDERLSKSVRDVLSTMRVGDLEPLGNVDPIGVPRTIGRPQEIGAPQTIGEPQTIGTPQDIGTPQTIGPEPEVDRDQCEQIEDREDVEVELESTRIRFDVTKRNGLDVETPSPSSSIIY